MNILQNYCPPVAMSVAEFNPSGQSGTIADMNTFAAHNCHGVAVVTALEFLKPGGEPGFHPTASTWLKESTLTLVREQGIRAIKIGMLCGRSGAQAVCEILDDNPSVPVVLDPDLRSFENFDGKEAIGAEILQSLLVPRATVVTPNAAEAAALTGLQVQSPGEMKAAAARLVEMGARSAVVTGGIFEKPFDVYLDSEVSETLAGERFKVEAPFGPGSTFSAAIAANLALGRHPHDAVVMAKAFVTEALRKGYVTASGTILLNHFYRNQQAPRVADFASGVPERVL